jgi:hypothetical protein
VACTTFGLESRGTQLPDFHLYLPHPPQVRAEGGGNASSNI